MAEGTLLEGRNPVLEALRSGREIDKLFLQKGLLSGSMRPIYKLAKERRIVIVEVERGKLDAMSETGVHQGVIAQVPAASYATLEELFMRAQEKGEAPFFVMAANLSDPHNLGAIVRSANCAGAHGVIIPKRGGVLLTATVEKAAAGALSYTPVCKVTNLKGTLETLKERGVWIYCADMAGRPYYETDFSGGVCLVVGSEGDGAPRLVREACDATVSIPMRGEIESMNASAAAAVLLCEVARQRRVASAP